MTTDEALASALREHAAAQRELALVIRRQGDLLETLLETVPATHEARLLGVSAATVRRRRAHRAAERALASR